jgi:hypothetical protein
VPEVCFGELHCGSAFGFFRRLGLVFPKAIIAALGVMRFSEPSQNVGISPPSFFLLRLDQINRQIIKGAAVIVERLP